MPDTGEFSSGSRLSEVDWRRVEDGRRCRMLLSSVLLQALTDLGTKPSKEERAAGRNLLFEPRSAASFFLHPCGGLSSYCLWLSFDEGQVRRALREGLPGGGRWTTARGEGGKKNIAGRERIIRIRIQWFDDEYQTGEMPNPAREPADPPKTAAANRIKDAFDER